MVGRPCRRSESGRETHLEGQTWTADAPGGPEEVKNHPGCVKLFGIASWRSTSGWECLPKVRKWSVTIPEVWNWLGDPPGGP